MKRIIITLLCAFAVGATALQAQSFNNALYVGAGPFSGIGGFVYGTVGFWESIGGSIAHKKVKTNLYGSYSLQYYHNVKPWCQVGVKATVEASKVIHFTDTTTQHVADQYSMAIVTLMPSVRFTYLNRPWVRLYSGIELGCGYLFDSRDFSSSSAKKGDDSEKSSNFLFAFNVTPIGLEVGKSFFGLLETNLGYDALVKVGVGYRF